jgi:hypothetical protein
MLAEHIVKQVIELSQGERINNEKKRTEQINKLLRLVDNFIERHPQYK